jgi:hypothetical protein
VGPGEDGEDRSQLEAQFSQGVLAADTYSNPANITSKGRGYIDAVAAFQGRYWAGVRIGTPYGGPSITGRSLELAVPQGASPSQQQALDDLITYGSKKGVAVTVLVVR